jgi:predicted ester cyclase
VTVGIHTGDFIGIPPTGKSVVGRFAAFDRIVDGKLVSSEVFLDVASLLIQLGVMEPPKF